MSLTLVTAPVGEPITLEETKAYLHVTNQDDDGLIDGLIISARQQFDGRDGWFGRALLTQTWDWTLPGFPYGGEGYLGMVEVPLPPLQSVTSVTYIDGDGNPQTASFTADIASDPGRIMPPYGTTWPATRQVYNAVTIRFIAGYGAAKDVPREIRNWLKQAVGYLYLNREASVLPSSFFWSMAKYKTWLRGIGVSPYGSGLPIGAGWGTGGWGI